ncbi:hypothetical protein [Neotabrizicola sp. VNH66]
MDDHQPVFVRVEIGDGGGVQPGARIKKQPHPIVPGARGDEIAV